MNTLIDTFKSAVSTAVLFMAGLFTVGLGFAFVGTIALFGLVAVGIALVAAPFVAPRVPASGDAETVV